MCMEDVRLGRETRSSQRTVTVTTTGVTLVGHSADRVALIISCPAAAAVYLSFDLPVVSGIGIMLPAGGSPFVLDLQKVGEAVTRGIYAVSSAGSQPVTVWEVTLLKQ